MTTTVRKVTPPRNLETLAWRWMRLSGVLLIPLAWIHVILQDVLVGVHSIDLDYVAMRWALLGWRVYDFFLLAFALGHGMNGLRQVLDDFVQSEQTRQKLAKVLFAIWLIILLIGAIAIIGGVRQP